MAKLYKIRKKCTGCAACANICPKQCITMQADHNGFLHPCIDETVCVNCSLCSATCPLLSNNAPAQLLQQAYGIHATDANIVSASSSGGTFTVLAEAIIGIGGVVFGAAFDGVDTVRHIPVETKAQLQKLRGSKYLQSEIGTTYRQAETLLNQGRAVLFSGTPCQIAGLKHYLRKEYETLLCVDIICHSVPSPKVWSSFLNNIETSTGKSVLAANFRDKQSGWEKYSLSLTLDDGGELHYTGVNNLYMQAFIQGLSTRDSCYSCPFKGANRWSDLTLGDFWGVRYTAPEVLHEKGTSLVLVNTTKGSQLLHSLSTHLVMMSVPFSNSIEPNPAYNVSSIPHKRRKQFFAQIVQLPFNQCVQELLKPTKQEILYTKVSHSLPVRALRRLKRAISDTK